MALPETISYCWPSTNATIPANWERTTAFDGNYVFWTAADDANTTGGAATHAHDFTSAAHAFSAGAGSGSERHDTVILKPSSASVTHTHASTSSNTGSVTSGAATNEPSWASLIFINPADAAQTGVPNNAWALLDTSSVPTGWTEPADLDNKLLKGAAAAGNADLTGGGNTAHLHSITHAHAAKSSANNTGTASVGDATDNNRYAGGVHAHSVSLDSYTLDSQADADSSMPLWQKLLWIKNETGGPDMQLGVIGFYLGAVANIPAGYERVDPSTRDFIMGAANTGEINATGGAATHAHTGTLHNHLYIAGAASNAVGDTDFGSTLTGSSAGHVHDWTIGSATDTVSANTSKSHYPPYIKAILLKCTSLGSGPRLLASTGAGN